MTGNSVPVPPATGNPMGVGRPLALGLVVIVVFVGGFAAWATLVSLASAVVAPGVVEVVGERKTVQHLEGGLVADILVQEGDTVVAGQPVVVLDGTQSGAARSVLEQQQVSAAALGKRLQAERDGLEAIDFPAWLRAAEEEDVGGVLATQARIFEARAQSLRTREAIHERRVAQLQEEASGFREHIAAQDRELELLGDEIADVAALVEKGYEPQTRLRALQRREAAVSGSRARNRAAIARIEQQVAAVHLSTAELRQSRQREVVEELREVERQLSELGERLAAARDVDARTQIRAPVSGTVVGLRVFTRGGVVGPGEALMDIVPAQAGLVVAAWVDPLDIESVSPGLSAEVRLVAYSRLTMAPLTGEVVGVSADRLLEPRTGAPYYEARVVLGQESRDMAAGKLHPGMPVEVLIVTGARTPLEYLLKPIAASFRRALREE